MRYALIGCGRIAAQHLAAAKAAMLTIVSVCDQKIDRAKELLLDAGLLNGAVQCYVDYQTMIERERPQLVAIATDSGSHAEIAFFCLSQGVHILIEKPMALSLLDAERMMRLAEERGLVLAPCHQNRFNPAVLTLRQAVEQGQLGKISHGALAVRWNRGMDYYAQAEWRGRWGSDGGVMMNQCIHGIDLLCWIIGSRVDWIFGSLARQLHPSIEVEDLGMALVHFENGALATIEGSSNVYPENLEQTLSIFGEYGTVRLGGAAANRVEVWRVRHSEAAPLPPPPPPPAAGQQRDVYGNGHLPLYVDVVAAINEKREPFVSSQDGYAALALVLALYQSHTRGGPVGLSSVAFASSDMKGTFR